MAASYFRWAIHQILSCSDRGRARVGPDIVRTARFFQLKRVFSRLTDVYADCFRFLDRRLVKCLIPTFRRRNGGKLMRDIKATLLQ